MADEPDESASQGDASRAFWIDRAVATQGTAAVLPSGRWLRYHEWTNRLLRDWTLSRATAQRARFRRFVDLGCGRGDWTVLFGSHAEEVYACDVAPQFVAETRARLVATHPDARVECADLRSYEMPRGIDLAYLGAVLMYLPEVAAAALLDKVRVASVAGGLVIVRDYCTFNLGRPSVTTATGYSVHRSPKQLIALARSVGLECLESRSSPSIYAEVMANRVLAWPLRAAWRLATLHWLRASHTFVLRA